MRTAAAESKVVRLRAPPPVPGAAAAASPRGGPPVRPRTADAAAHRRNATFTRTFAATPSARRDYPASVWLARAVQGGGREAGGGGAAGEPYVRPPIAAVLAARPDPLPAYDRRASSPRFARAAAELAGVGTGEVQTYWSPEAARPYRRPVSAAQSRMSWHETLTDWQRDARDADADAASPARPSSPSPSPRAHGLQRPTFLEAAAAAAAEGAHGYAGFRDARHSESVGELFATSSLAPPPPPALSPRSPRALGSLANWASKMHGAAHFVAARDGGGDGGVDRGGGGVLPHGGECLYAYVQTEHAARLPRGAGAERAHARDVARLRADELRQDHRLGHDAGAHVYDSRAHRAAAPSPRLQLRDERSPAARAVVAVARSPSAAAVGAKLRQYGGTAHADEREPPGGGPLALAAALARARIPDMRRSVAGPHPQGCALASACASESWKGARPKDALADLGVGGDDAHALARARAEEAARLLPRRGGAHGPPSSVIKVRARARARRVPRAARCAPRTARRSPARRPVARVSRAGHGQHRGAGEPGAPRAGAGRARAPAHVGRRGARHCAPPRPGDDRQGRQTLRPRRPRARAAAPGAQGARGDAAARRARGCRVRPRHRRTCAPRGRGAGRVGAAARRRLAAGRARRRVRAGRDVRAHAARARAGRAGATAVRAHVVALAAQPARRPRLCLRRRASQVAASVALRRRARRPRRAGRAAACTSGRVGEGVRKGYVGAVEQTRRCAGPAAE
jgi:hypothetical protein